MPHSNFKGKLYSFNSGLIKCPCSQTFHYESETDWYMKIQMHCTVCPNPPEGSEQMWRTKKFMTIKEQQHYEAEMMRKLHDHY